MEIAETYVDQNSAQAFYDDIAIPTLRLAENDRQRSASDGTYKRTVADSMISVVREISDHIRQKQNAPDPNLSATHQGVGFAASLYRRAHRFRLRGC